MLLKLQASSVKENAFGGETMVKSASCAGIYDLAPRVEELVGTFSWKKPNEPKHIKGQCNGKKTIVPKYNGGR